MATHRVLCFMVRKRSSVRVQLRAFLCRAKRARSPPHACAAIWRADDRDLGDRLQRPPRRLVSGRLGGDARPVALEARGRAGEHVGAGASVWLASAWATLRGAKKSSPALGERVLDLEDQLALEHVEGLVEVVRVQRRAGAVRRDLDLGHGHVAAGPRCAEGRSSGGSARMASDQLLFPERSRYRTELVSTRCRGPLSGVRASVPVTA